MGEAFRWLQQRLSEWLTSLHADDSWDDVSPDEALLRVELLTENARMDAGMGADGQVGCVRIYYFWRALAYPNLGGDGFWRLYWLTMHGLVAPDSCEIEALVAFANRQFGCEMWHISVLIDYCCFASTVRSNNEF